MEVAWEAVKLAKRPRVHTFLATSAIHMEYKLKMTPDQVQDSCLRPGLVLHPPPPSDLPSLMYILLPLHAYISTVKLMASVHFSRVLFADTIELCLFKWVCTTIQFPFTCRRRRDHLEQLHTTVQVVENAVKAVRHLRSLGCTDIEFSPEDAGRSDPKFLYRVLAAVIEAGATTLNIPDTTGKHLNTSAKSNSHVLCPLPNPWLHHNTFLACSLACPCADVSLETAARKSRGLANALTQNAQKM